MIKRMSMIELTDPVDGRVATSTSLPLILERFGAGKSGIECELTVKPAHQPQIFCEWNRTEADFPQDKCIHEMFGEQVARSPNAPALLFENEYVSYAELNRRSNQLAHYLGSLGVGPDALVAVCAERSVEMVVALLAIVKAGGSVCAAGPLISFGPPGLYVEG